jgi:hypothetical protein
MSKKRGYYVDNPLAAIESLATRTDAVERAVVAVSSGVLPGGGAWILVNETTGTEVVPVVISNADNVPQLWLREVVSEEEAWLQSM